MRPGQLQSLGEVLCHNDVVRALRAAGVEPHGISVLLRYGGRKAGVQTAGEGNADVLSFGALPYDIDYGIPQCAVSEHRAVIRVADYN